MTMSSLARIPLTSLFTAVDKSELCSPEFSAAGRCRFRSRKWACNSSISTGYGNGGIVCKAASVEPRAVIEGLSIAEDVSQGKSSSPTTKEDLGRATWTFLHTLAAQYPDKPTRQQKRDVKELMAILSRMYPCKECADHFKEVIRSNPVEAGSHHEFSQWVCRVHNVVNRSLGKLVFPCERVDARWGKLECEQRACDLQGTSMNFSNELK